MRRLRAGEWLAGSASVALLVTLCFHWFTIDQGARRGWAAYAPGVVHQSGWGTLGWFLDALLVVVALGGLSIAYMTLRRTSPAWPVGASILTVAVGAIAFLILLVRVALAQPDLGVGLSNSLVAARLPAYLGLLFCALIPAGAWLALRDERLDAPESASTPPPARPIPGT